MSKILPFLEVIKPYEAIIFDIWGVIYDGIEPYPKAIQILNHIIESEKKVMFLSNNPRPHSFAKQNLEKWGINIEKSVIYTSGDAVREYLTSLNKSLYHLGAERNQDILSGIDIDLTDDISKADFLFLTAYSDPGEDFERYDDILRKALKLGMPAICANPDVYVQHGEGIRKCSGAFGAKYEAMGGIVHYFGKPNVSIFNKLIEGYLPDLQRDKILMVGDTIETDILGANRAGIHSVLLLTGNGRIFKEKLANGVLDIFASQPAKPTWVSNGIAE